MTAFVANLTTGIFKHVPASNDILPTHALDHLRAFTKIEAGGSLSTVLPDFDFETFSKAGFIWSKQILKWVAPKGARKPGIEAVGAAHYAQHPSTEVLSLAYNLKDRLGPRLWLPGMDPPYELFNYLANGGLIEAHNAGFEWWIWNYVCHKKYGWPVLDFRQMRCSAAKSRAWGLPGKLAEIGKLLPVSTKKDSQGERLIRKFTIPQTPTKKKLQLRILPSDDWADFGKFNDYNIGDIETESDISSFCPDLNAEELEFWKATQLCNYRGVTVDSEGIDACIVVMEQHLEKINSELTQITGGIKSTETQQLTKWLQSRVSVDLIPNLQKETIRKALEDTKNYPIPPDAKRVLRIRQLSASASVKKLYAMRRQLCEGNKLHDLFNYHGARTGRDSSNDAQPQSSPKGGPKLNWCEDYACKKPYGRHLKACPWCGADEQFSKKTKWRPEAFATVLDTIKTGSVETVSDIFGDPLLAIAGCIRGLYTASPGNRLICSDFSSIEAVVIAMLAGEIWRIDTFKNGEDIYLKSASKITGIPVSEYLEYKEKYGEHHPHRQEIGKIAELALGFKGWINAWLNFDKSGRFDDQHIKNNILAWWDASPAIVELWGGQIRGKPWAIERFELFGIEGCAIAAIQNPGQCFDYRGITYGVKEDVLYARLPSGRLLAYHKPRLSPSTRWSEQLQISFEGWNTNPKAGARGWIRMQTHGGKLTENYVQATARDIMRDSLLRLESAGYPVVLRLHDELIADVPTGFGSLEQFEYLMSRMPEWAADWPIRATGGWEDFRYRKAT